MVEVSIRAKVTNVKPGLIKGQSIATAEHERGVIVFDVIEGVYKVEEGDVLELTVSEEKPYNLDEQDFCGHGYLVTDEKIGETLLSIWGIVFRFKPPLGLRLEQKYYLCFKKLRKDLEIS